MSRRTRFLCPIFRERKQQKRTRQSRRSSLDEIDENSMRKGSRPEPETIDTEFNAAISCRTDLRQALATLEGALEAENGQNVSSIRLRGPYRPSGLEDHVFNLWQLALVLGQFTSLKTLEIDNLSLVNSVHGVTNFLQSGRRALVHLRLESIGGRLAGFPEEVKEALRHHPTLQRVYLGSSETEELWDVLSTCSQLQSLEINLWGTDFVPSLLQHLQGHPNLQELHIHMDSTVQDIGAISNYLRNNAVIESLTISFPRGYRISDLAGVAEALVTNRSLKRLSFQAMVLPHCRTDDTTPFINMLQKNTILEEVRTKGWSTDQHKEVDCILDEAHVNFYCRLNGDGRRHYLIKSGLSSQNDWVDTIISNHKDTPIVFFLLSRNPGLLANLNYDKLSSKTARFMRGICRSLQRRDPWLTHGLVLKQRKKWNLTPPFQSASATTVPAAPKIQPHFVIRDLAQ